MFLQCCTEDPVIGPLFCLSFYWFNKAYLSSPTSVELVSSFPGLEVLKGNEIARLCPYTHTHQISLRHQANTPVPDLPFPLHGTNPGAPSTPSLLILCMPILSCMP